MTYTSCCLSQRAPVTIRGLPHLPNTTERGAAASHFHPPPRLPSIQGVTHRQRNQRRTILSLNIVLLTKGTIVHCAVSAATQPSCRPPVGSMDSRSSNPLLSSQRSSQLQAVLHPLVLLTISDYITRHTLRQQTGPIVGALLGQQNGREITIEHAFECHTSAAPTVEGGFLLDAEKFSSRLEQSRRPWTYAHLGLPNALYSGSGAQGAAAGLCRLVHSPPLHRPDADNHPHP